MLARDPDVERWSTYVGRGAIRFYLPLNAQLPNPFFAQAVVVAKDLPARDAAAAGGSRRCWPSSSREVVARVYPLELGPPVGWPVQYRVVGPEVETRARHRASASPQAIAADPGARGVNFDWIEPARQLRVRVDQDQARLLGLSSAQLRRGAERRAHGHAR